MNQKDVETNDIVFARDYCASVNQNTHEWARMEIIHVGSIKLCRVYVGAVLSNGLHERHIKIRTFTLNNDHTVSIHDEVTL